MSAPLLYTKKTLGLGFITVNAAKNAERIQQTLGENIATNACLFDAKRACETSGLFRAHLAHSIHLEKSVREGKGKASKHTDALRKEREDDVRPSIAVE